MLDSDALRATGVVLAAMDAQVVNAITFEGIVVSHIGGPEGTKGLRVEWSDEAEGHVVVIP